MALCYTGDLSSPDERLYTLDYYLRLAEQIVDVLWGESPPARWPSYVGPNRRTSRG